LHVAVAAEYQNKHCNIFSMLSLGWLVLQHLCTAYHFL